jgi:PAS domain S-box-containing protein
METLSNDEVVELERLRAALAEERAARIDAETRLAAERSRCEQIETRLVSQPSPPDDDERRAIERALSETLVAVNAGYWEIDLRSGRTVWSDGAYRLMGYEPGSVEPSNDLWRARTHPDDYARMMAGPLEPNIETEYRIVRPDGTVRWARSTMNTVFGSDGTPQRLRGILVDCSREREVALQLARLAEVASRTESGVVITDLEARIEWVNEAFVRRTGYALEEAKGKTPFALVLGEHTDRATVARLIEASRLREPVTVELLTYSRTGRQTWIQIESRVALDERGEPIGFIAIETDITERRIAASRESLAQRVAALLLASRSVEDAAERLVAELVRELDIRIAQLWVVDPSRTELSYVAGAAADASGTAGAHFLEVTRGMGFARGIDRDVGIGLPGKAWGTASTVTLDELATPNVHAERSRRRAEAAAAGVNTFCATPILGPDAVLGVLEIAGTSYYPGHEQIPALVERVAEQFAAFMRHELARRAFRTVFEQSPDALLLADVTGRVRAANSRARALFGEPDGAAVDALIDGATALVTRELAAAAEPDRVHALHRCEARGAAGPFSAELSIALTPGSEQQAAILAVRDLTERHRMEAALTQSLREKETLLREVHHRVKNNLQIVSSLLTLQGETLADARAREAIVEMVDRVRSMSLVHQQLYGSENLYGVDLGDYALTLGRHLKSSLAPDATLSFATERVEVAIDVAVPCGLILNELVTNALKHGRAADGRCAISVVVRASNDTFSLVVADEGPGFSETPTNATSLGMQLIRSLARQLRGALEFASEGGARVSITVPIVQRTVAGTLAPASRPPSVPPPAAR